MKKSKTSTQPAKINTDQPSTPVNSIQPGDGTAIVEALSFALSLIKATQETPLEELSDKGVRRLQQAKKALKKSIKRMRSYQKQWIKSDELFDPATDL